ncbi:MAG: beta-ketoacyl-[acyl-carrier-protein] synthase family protein [Betaproteobacteria bacterium]|nr:beta-ketoacyl-[acyl-carrier-protein] synthase family protein [Betaproteobacteria bacterium]
MRRVVVTGTGVLTPVGRTTEEFFASLIEVRSGIGPVEIPLSGVSGLPVAAQIKGFDPSTHFPKERLSQLDRFSQFALVAAREAWLQAGSPVLASPDSGAVYFGTGFGGASTLESGYDDLFRKGLNRVKPMSVVAAMPNAAAANVAIEFRLQGACYTYAVACASSAVAIGEAFRAIAAGAADIVVAGGAESILTYGIMRSWQALMALAVEDKAAPETSCRPFAKDRTGLVLGEGAGVLVLESLEHATQRGANPLAEIAGYGIANDGLNLSRPDVEGQARAIRIALREAERSGVAAADIGYINAHGTATKVGDKVETQSLKAAFGTAVQRIPVSSTKALHGHLMGAGGAVEFIAALMAMRRRILPPTAHLRIPDPECDLDYIALASRRVPELDGVMSNSFAFGGTNAVLIARPVQ